jgi:hypothetical protein
LPELSLKITGSAIHHKVLVMFMRLSLLPICSVGSGFDGLIGFIEQNNLRDDFGEFIEYFENTWFNRYPVNTWCVSERYRRSNNHLEGYNCQVKRIIPEKPTPWAFLRSLLDLAYDASFISDRRNNILEFTDRSKLTAPLLKLQENSIDELGFLETLAQF